MRETGCCDYSDYYRHIASGSRLGQEWSMLVDCLTVHETCFFRHASSMKLVEEVVIPGAAQRDGSFNAWSVGCATGEEAYSLAMLADAYGIGSRSKWYYGVTGTDISLPALRKARAGCYLKRRQEGISTAFQDLYCESVSDSHFEIKAGLRKRVCFSQLNLRDLERAPFVNLDLIYCQNLLIYYDRERRLDIVSRLAEFLRPGGVLILGPGELLNWQHPGMEKVRYEDTLAYRRTD